MAEKNTISSRPALHLGLDVAEAVDELVDRLQRGVSSSDADMYDSIFADDILWGTPKGRVLQGYGELNAIHHRLMAASVAPPSTFVVDQVITPSPDVVVAQISRVAVEPGGFSEVAMYVLVRRDERWWVSAVQNTPITDQLPS
ncbi:nuclear transport factor 2 family protein [Gordonia soli]|uniref:DUF4440 domain-containing protein n=1 Tax=Gordonia soli NBRC 108243 TaxID=1223545 RepID=M0QIL8_9ACTN|nr:nuclear transport factor 2 family protein [Gordonia soli]GAC67282.1 hypothetical protein GS4_07_00310 [Gordonia soli NBRC 108243]